MISDETIERVREGADIVQIIGEFVKLKKSGNSYRGPCPFHNGSNPNFSVSPREGMYHCFVCGVSGDTIKFIREKLNLDFTAAVKLVGEKSGIEVIDAPRTQPPDPNARHWEVLTLAAEWFQRQLADEALGREARAYLDRRGLDAAAIARFGIGYAPSDRAALRKFLNSLGFDDQRQLDAGILSLREGDTEPRMNFRNRVMFPILDELGHAVGFGGRALGDATPKYLNSPESPVFQKGKTLYGMNTAKHAMRRAERSIVVEGYMDAISVALAGFNEVVAPLGTALTEAQAEMLARYGSEVFLFYDSDQAGQKATFRAGLELLRHKVAVRVVTLPDNDDPDTFAQREGSAGLEKLFLQAMDLFDRQVQLLERRGAFRDLSSQRKAIDKLLPTIVAAEHPLTRELYITRLAEVTRLEKSVIAREAEESAQLARRVRRSASPDGTVVVRRPVPPAEAEWTGEPMPEGPGNSGRPSFMRSNSKPPWKPRGGRDAKPEWRASWVPPSGRIEEPAERALIAAMLADRSCAERIAERHGPSGFRDPRYKALFEVFLMAPTDEGLDQIAERVDEEAAAALRELAHRVDGRDFEAVDVSLNLAKLDVRKIELLLATLREEIRHLDPEQQLLLVREEIELTQERNKLLPMRSPRGKPRK